MNGYWISLDAVQTFPLLTRWENRQVHFTPIVAIHKPWVLVWDLLPAQGIEEELEMRRLDASFAWGAHDVVETGGDFKYFESLLSQVSVPADIAITKSEDMAELMSQRARG